MIGPWFPADPGKIGADPPPIWATLFLGPSLGCGCLVFGDLRRSGIGVEMAPKRRHPQPRLGPRKRVAQMVGGLVAIPQDLPETRDQPLGINGV